MIKSVMPLSRNILIIICLAMITGMLFIGLWPFNYSQPNQVLPMEGGDGIRFGGGGIALSRAGSAQQEDILSKEPVTLQLRLKPERTYHRGIPHILSLCDRKGREVFFLGQWRTYLIVRLMDGSGWLDRIKRQAGFKDLLIPGKQVLVTLVFSGGDMDVYADGSPVRRYSGFKLGEALADRPVRSLVLGNSSLADRPWRGEIFDLSVARTRPDEEAVQDRYDRWTEGDGGPTGTEGGIITYRFDNYSGRTIRNASGDQWDLVIPGNLTPLRRELLSLPEREYLRSGSFYLDAAVNLFGFIPFGWLGAWLLLPCSQRQRWLCIALPALAGGLLSLVIEVNQAFLVYRNSSITDLVLNTLGAAVGALCVVAYSSIRASGKQSG